MVELKTAYNSHLYADYWIDLAPKSQDWTHTGVKNTIDTRITLMNIKGGYQIQWPTLKVDQTACKATVMIKADGRAREQLLKTSGVNTLIFLREHPADDKKMEMEYCPVWTKLSS